MSFKTVASRMKEKLRQENKERSGQRVKLKKLLELVENDHVFSDKDAEFIERANRLFDEGKILTEAQVKYLDDCFEKY